jgi:hypothetical protein
MPIKLNREEFLRHLQIVQAGLSPEGIIEQSNCLIFKNGKVFTYNDEVACCAKSGLPSGVTAAVPAAPVFAMLGKYKEDMIGVRFTKSRMYIQGKGRESWMSLDQEITLPLTNVDLPKKNEWEKINSDFCEAVALVQECASKKNDETFALTCIHVHPKWIEAGDNDQTTRYRLKTGVSKPVCIRRDALKHIVPFVPTEMAITKTWLHFRNKEVSISCRLWYEQYPNWSPYFDVEGTKTSLPKGLVEACEKASYFSEQNENNWVKVTIRPGKLWLEAEGVSGGHRERKKLHDYAGKKMTFFIGPKLLSEIVKKQNECIVSEEAMLIDGGKWQFIASLEKNNGKQQTDDTDTEGSDDDGD